jgi:hypothetical protein
MVGRVDKQNARGVKVCTHNRTFLSHREKEGVLRLEMQYDMQDTTVAEDFIVQKHGLLNIDLDRQGNKAISSRSPILSPIAFHISNFTR